MPLKPLQSFENPFHEHNARDMEPESILQFWCEPWQLYDLTSVDLFREPNLLLEGGRGCGKTMLLKYLGFRVQELEAINIRKTLLDHILSREAVGFYIRIDNAVLNNFRGLDQTDGFADKVFTHFLELTICREYIEFLKSLDDSSSIKQYLDKNFFEDFGQLLGDAKMSSLTGLQNFVTSEIKKVDTFRRNITFEDIQFPVESPFGLSDLTVRAAQLICRHLDPLHNVRLLIAIDEYENFGERQQRLINTLLKSQVQNVGFRLGMRHEGLKTKLTVGQSEFIKENRDYRKARFRDILAKDPSYRAFLKAIAEKRLRSNPFFSDAGMIDIKVILGKEDNVNEARKIASKDPLLHFSLLKEVMTTQDEINTAIPILRYPENPLLEMLNILWTIRKKPLMETRAAMLEYLRRVKSRELSKDKESSEGEMEPWQKYRRDLVHKYGLSLLLQLARVHKVPKKYYGFNIFCFLSSGIPGNFINLCKTTILKAYHSGPDELRKRGTIDIEIQDKAARHEALIELSDIRSIPEHPMEISHLVLNLGKRFQECRDDPHLTLPEANTFSLGELQPPNQDILKEALTWSIVQKKTEKQSTTPKGVLTDIYAVNRMFVPLFEISYRTRGGLVEPFSDTEFSALCSEKGLRPKKPKDVDPSQTRIDEVIPS